MNKSSYRITNNISKYCPLQEMELNSMPIHVKTQKTRLKRSYFNLNKGLSKNLQRSYLVVNIKPSPLWIGIRHIGILTNGASKEKH